MPLGRTGAGFGIEPRSVVAHGNEDAGAAARGIGGGLQRAGDKEAALDDSMLVETVLAANPPAELEKDEAILQEALATPGLSEAERRRVRALAVLPRHAILTRDFQLSFDSEKTGNMAPDFAEKGIRLLDFRIKEVLPAVTPVNWGPTFRAYPFEVKYWRQRPIKKILNKLYPEMGSAG